jgi:dihydroorotase
MTLFRQARLIDPASNHDGLGALRVRGGEIVEIAEDLAPLDGEEIIELDGKALAPALIDLRVETSLSAGGVAGLARTAEAAAAGGVGTLVVHPRPGLARPEAFAAIEAAALDGPVNLLAAGLLVDEAGELGEAGLMMRVGAAMLGDGGRAIRDAALLRRALSYASTFDAWTSLRAEDADLAAGTCAHEGDLAMRLGLPARPAAGERLAIERGAVLAELTGAQILFDRITTAEGLAALRQARARGLEIAASAPISHLMFNAVDTGGFDARYRLEPPLRDESDRLALIAALAEGDIDVIVSDHRACTGEAKAHPFPEAESGSANLEALLPALCTLAADGRIKLVDALRAVTSTPAQLLGLPQGRLEPGAPADLVVFDPDAPLVYGRTGLTCQASSAFEGRRLYGRVLITLVNGVMIHQPAG